MTGFENTHSKPGFKFSTNNGVDWTGNLVTPPGYDNGFDPSCAFDRNGYAYYCYIAQRNPGTSHLGPVHISRTTTFQPPFTWNHYKVSPDTLLQDKPYMAIDNTGGLRDGRIYVSWTDFNFTDNKIKVAYSTDQGVTWSTPYTLDYANPHAAVNSIVLKPDSVPSLNPDAPLVQGSVPAVAQNGDVYVAWLFADGNPERTGRIKVRKSTNGGVTFGPEVIAAQISDYLFGPDGYFGSLRASSMPSITVSPVTGYVYIVYTVADAEAFEANIYFTYSIDGGSTWSTPNIATERTYGWQFFPWLTVASSGTISLVYYEDTENEGISVRTYVAQSYNGSNFYTPNFTVGSTSSIPYYTDWYSDYIGLASSPKSDVVAGWADFRNADGEHLNADIFGARDGSPAQPQGLTVVNNGPAPNNNPRLNWKRNKETDLATSPYKIWRKITGQDFFDWTNIATVSDTNYIDHDIGIYKPYVYTVYYKLKAVDNAGNQSVFSNEGSIVAGGLLWKTGRVTASSDEIPTEYALVQNHPNPFNPSTVVNYTLPVQSKVTLLIYNVLGQEVIRLADENQNAGYYTARWDGVNAVGNPVTTGLYFYKLEARGTDGHTFTEVRKMLLLK